MFDDYLTVMDKSSTLLTSLPTPVFWYGLVVGQEFFISPANPADLLLKGDGPAAAGADVKIRLERVGPAKKGGMRTVSFKVGGAVQNVEVKDSVAGNDFDGPMADAGNALEVCIYAPVCVRALASVASDGSVCVCCRVCARGSVCQFECHVSGMARQGVGHTAFCCSLVLRQWRCCCCPLVSFTKVRNTIGRRKRRLLTGRVRYCCRPLSISIHFREDTSTPSRVHLKKCFDLHPRARASRQQVGSPMPGVVEKVLVTVGASVSEGEVVAIVSAMKMEVQVKATSAGTVAALSVEEGGKVIEGALIVTLKE